MTNQPLNAAALRGAVDLSSLKKPAASGPGAARAPERPTQPGGIPQQPSAAGSEGAATQGNPFPFGKDSVVVPTAVEDFQSLVQLSMQHPVIVTVWAASKPASRKPVEVLAKAVRKQEGRVLLAIANLDTDPEIGQLFAQLSQQAAAQGQPGQVLAAAFVQGQPIPIPPVMEDAQGEELLGQITQIAVQNGLAGRVAGFDPNTLASIDESGDGQGDSAAGNVPAEPELPATHKLAYEAIEKGDYAGAIAAFEQALKDDPKDDEARLALGQMKLMQRTQGADLNAARAAAANNPADLEAQMMVADLDLLGGHVEDAFIRLVDVVKATTGDERTKVREHLIELFDVVGPNDPRVKKGRTALMSALY